MVSSSQSHQNNKQFKVSYANSTMCSLDKVQFPVGNIQVSSKSEMKSSSHKADVKIGDFVSSSNECNKETLLNSQSTRSLAIVIQPDLNKDAFVCEKKLINGCQPELSSSQVLSVNKSKSKSITSNILHRHLAHTSLPILKKVISMCDSRINIKENNVVLSFCDACKQGKHRWGTFS